MITEGELLEMDIRLRKLESAITDFGTWSLAQQDWAAARSMLAALSEGCREDHNRLSEYARKSLETVG